MSEANETSTSLLRFESLLDSEMLIPSFAFWFKSIRKYFRLLLWIDSLGRVDMNNCNYRAKYTHMNKSKSYCDPEQNRKKTLLFEILKLIKVLFSSWNDATILNKVTFNTIFIFKPHLNTLLTCLSSLYCQNILVFRK